MAFHACNATTSTTYCGNPAEHTTHIAESDDGATWTQIPGFYSGWAGSVPDLVIRGTTIYVYNPSTVTRINKGSGGLVSSNTVTITTSTGAAVSYVDPSPYLDPATGKIVLFYLDSTGIMGDPAGCGGVYPCYKYFRSATETGSQGRTFVQDSGYRMMVTIASAADPVGIMASDPDIFYDGSNYYQLVARGMKVQIFTSTTLTGSYTPVVGSLTDGVLVNGTSGVAAGHYDSATAKYWLYAHDALSPSVIRMAVVNNLTTTLYNTDFATVLNVFSAGLNPLNYSVSSPGFHAN